MSFLNGKHIGSIFSLLVGILIAATNPSGAENDPISLMMDGDMSRASCPEDYTPCSCTVDVGGGLRVVCTEVAVQDVVDVFNRTSAQDIETFGLQWSRSPLESVTIPADLLGGSRAKLIGVYCPSKVEPRVPLRVHDDAFRLSRDYADTFLTFYCDFSQQPNLQFLAGFNNLTILEIGLATNLQAIGNLPTLPALTTLHVMDSTGLVEFPDLTPAVLQTLFLNGNQLGDTMAAALLDSIIVTSTIRLFTLRLNSNQLTRVPTQQMNSLPELKNLYLDDNSLPVLETGSLTFTFPVTTLSLSSASINTIEPGAFLGDFSMSVINLSNNNLTRFESAVFLGILEQMNLPFAVGYIDIESNLMKCDCSLAWLIRDNRSLMPAVHNGLCVNGIAFESLDPADFADCP
ncbi:hypothetical protein GHT06_019851 [Daphnia sinensis]|uniref:Membrane glycoprotein lig-1 n=1 Tax=Daphnia sinensis TaxID=1820382 RepID=A0AAD5PQZ9_9CRUS|nr:hypothetical protein GHT06_019851 [Daphnia sinensis]